MHTYNIKPMMVARMNSEKGPMTYLTYHGQPVVRHRIALKRQRR